MTPLKIAFYAALVVSFAASAAPRSATLPKPETPIDLIRNMKDAAENDLVLQPEFYNQQTLLTNFGGGHVQVQNSDDNTQKRSDYVITEFPDGLGLKGIRSDIWLTRLETGGKIFGFQSQIYFGPSNRMPTFEDLRSNLGTGWKEDAEAEDKRYSAAVREPFNKNVSRPLIMTYAFPSSSYGKSLELNFGSDHRLVSMFYTALAKR